MEDDATIDILYALDGITFLIFLRIATAYQHDADSSSGIEFYGTLVEIAHGNTLEEVYDVAFQSQHHTLCLWVAHTTVIFDDKWFWLLARSICAVDESKEDKSLIVDTVGSKTFYGRTNDAVFNLLHPILSGKWHRGNATHTACIETSVVLTDTLVVLCLRQNLVVLAIGKYKDAALDATHELLDDHTAGSITKHTSQHILEFLLGLVEGGEDKYTLTST